MIIKILFIISIILLISYSLIRYNAFSKSFYLVDSFLFGIFFYTIGSLFLYSESYNIKYEIMTLISCIALISALLGSILSIILTKNKHIHSGVLNNLTSTNHNLVKKILFFSIFICSIFIYTVITNQSVFLLILDTFASIDSNYTAARKAITSGTDGYFAPGYVKQFRDILGPIAMVTLILLKPKGYKKTAFITFPILISAMLLSGQRSIIIIFLLLYFLVVLRSTSHVTSNFKKIIFISFSILIFYLLSVFIGRVSSESTSFLNIITDTLFSFFERTVLTVPYENSVYFEFWWQNPTYGYSWFSEIERIMLGSNSGFSNKLHSLNLGSIQGNSVLGLPIDVYFAYGYTGVILFPFIYSILINKFDKVLRKSNYTIIYVCRIYLFITIPIMYSPYGFLLYGGGIVLVLLAIIPLLNKKLILNI